MGRGVEGEGDLSLAGVFDPGIPPHPGPLPGGRGRIEGPWKDMQAGLAKGAEIKQVAKKAGLEQAQPTVREAISVNNWAENIYSKP